MWTSHKSNLEGQDGPVSLTWLPDKFQSVGLSVQEKKFNIDFQDGAHLRFLIRKILATFLSTSHLDTSNEVSSQLALPSEEKIQNRFSTLLLGRHRLSNQNDFIYLWSTSHPHTCYQVSSQLAFGFRRRSAKKISKNCHGGLLRFPIGIILNIFDLQVILMLSTKFWVNWPFGSEEEAKNRFPGWRPPWNSDQNDFSDFWSTSHSDAFYQVSS